MCIQLHMCNDFTFGLSMGKCVIAYYLIMPYLLYIHVQVLGLWE